MQKHPYRLLLTVVPALMLALATASASAGVYFVSSPTFRQTWTALEFAEPGLGIATRCQVTFEGSFHSRTIHKVVGSLIGYVTRATMAACTEGVTRTSFIGLPWHLRYASFTGTLPNMTLLAFDYVEIWVWINFPFFGECHYRGIWRINWNREAGARFTSATAGGRIGAAPENGFGCPTGINGTGTTNTLTVLNATTRISVTLI